MIYDNYSSENFITYNIKVEVNYTPNPFQTNPSVKDDIDNSLAVRNLKLNT